MAKNLFSRILCMLVIGDWDLSLLIGARARVGVGDFLLIYFPIDLD